MLSLPLSLGRTISRVHQSLLLTLTPIFILGEHGPDNMGRKWVYGRKLNRKLQKYYRKIQLPRKAKYKPYFDPTISPKHTRAWVLDKGALPTTQELKLYDILSHHESRSGAATPDLTPKSEIGLKTS